MSYSEQKKQIDDFQNLIKNKVLSESEELLLKREPSDLEQIKKACVEFIYKDLIKKEIDYSFKSSLGNSQYSSANSEANLCIDISLLSFNILPKKVPDWTEHAQKCFDYLIIKFISDGLKEKIQISSNRVYETDIYNYLEDKEDEQLKLIGSRFKSIYQYRSKFKHVHYTDENGFRRIREVRTKDLVKAKSVIMDFFKESLSALFPLYQNMFPS
jgi:hypothetical protein